MRTPRRFAVASTAAPLVAGLSGSALAQDEDEAAREFYVTGTSAIVEVTGFGDVTSTPEVARQVRDMEGITYDRQQMEVVSAMAAVENDEGRWAGPATYLGGAELGDTMTAVMHGEGAYEGLTAYVVMDLGAQTFAASIFPGDMPPFPLDPPTE